MAATTDNRKWQADGGALTRDQIANALNGPIAANTVLYTGQIVGQLYTDTATHPALQNYVADGTMRAVGICTVGADNTVAGGVPSGAANSRPPRVVAAVGIFVDKNAGGASAFSNALSGLLGGIFQPAYGVDNQTVSALASDGPCIGQFVGLDFNTGQPMVLIDPVTAMGFAIRQTLCIPIPLAGLVVGGGTAAQITPGFAGRILAVEYDTSLVGAGAGATFAMTLKIGATTVTGGAATLTLANQTQGATLAGTAITALNAFTAAQAISVVNAAGTVFTSGQVNVNLRLG
jgi:hypothetical protein